MLSGKKYIPGIEAKRRQLKYLSVLTMNGRKRSFKSYDYTCSQQYTSPDEKIFEKIPLLQKTSKKGVLGVMWLLAPPIRRNVVN